LGSFDSPYGYLATGHPSTSGSHPGATRPIWADQTLF
jgi:hypothetical protein